ASSVRRSWTMAVARWEPGPPLRAERWATDGHLWRRSFFPILILNMRSAMNRIKLCSGGFAASLMVLVAASAVAQGAGEWTMAGRTYDIQGYSPLTQISRANVKNLKAAWTFSTGVLSGHEGNPLVIGTVMYVHSAFPNVVFALDLTKPGAPMIWRHQPAQPPEAKAIACCDLVNRRLAYHAGTNRLFIALPQGDLPARDANGGKRGWRRAGGGGTTWGWYSYDPQLNLFYYGSGNPGSWNPDQRPGDNKWSMTIFARNPDNGEAKWAYQMTPHDEWDYDGVNEMVLFDATIGGKAVKALAHFDRNGFGYVVDRTNGKVLVAQPYAHAAPNWASKIDLQTGVPVRNPQYGTTSKKNTEGICPAAIGSKD